MTAPCHSGAACQAAAVVVCLPRSSASENSRVCALASGTRRLRIVDLPMPDCPTRSTVLPVKTSSSLARASSGRSDADISIVCAPIERSSAVCWSAAARPSDRSSLLRMTTAGIPAWWAASSAFQMNHGLKVGRGAKTTAQRSALAAKVFTRHSSERYRSVRRSSIVSIAAMPETGGVQPPGPPRRHLPFSRGGALRAVHRYRA